MRDGVQSAAKERVLRTAEQLFGERGYDSVTLRDIAQALQIRQASLYHHFPEGKEQLFIEVTERSLARHNRELRRVLAEAPADVREQLLAAAHWLLSQPPIDIARMVRSDMPAISPEQAQRLTQAALDSLVTPLEDALVAARERGEITFPEAYRRERLLAGSLLAIIDNARVSEKYARRSAASMVENMIDVLLVGLYPR